MVRRTFVGESCCESNGDKGYLKIADEVSYGKLAKKANTLHSQGKHKHLAAPNSNKDKEVITPLKEVGLRPI